MSNPEKKRYGVRFNLFDAMLILAVIVCIGAIAAHAYFTKDLNESYAETANITFTVSGISQHTAEVFCVAGHNLYLQDNDHHIGSLATATYHSQKLYLENASGTLVKVSHPDKYEISATAKMIGTWTEDGFMIDGTLLATIGKTLNIYTEDAVCTLTITGIAK